MTQQDLFPVGGLTKQHKPSPTYLQEPANQRTGPRRAWYKQEFRVQFLKTRGMEFQRLVERVLNAAFPTVFSVIKPKGPRGDLKSDGFIHSRGALLQVYAPDNLNIREIEKKIRADFEGAKELWRSQMREWIFVLNNEDGYGVDAEVHRLLATIQDENPAIQLILWSFPQLFELIERLPEHKVQELLGSYPYDQDDRPPPPDVRFIRDILDKLAKRVGSLPPESNLNPVPADKLRHNRLSDVAADDLRRGMIWSRALETYWNASPINDLRTKTAALLSFEYSKAKNKYNDTEDTPDYILSDLRQFLYEDRISDSRYNAAVNVILAHFFESCDIFERPPENL